MKQGSTDDPFADDDGDDPFADDDGDESSEATDAGENERLDAQLRDETEELDDRSSESPDRQQSTRESDRQRQSLPYIHARDGVKDGRTQRPVFLREDTETGIDELVAQMEDEFGEDVYKTDVTEAAMVVAQEHPELVVDVLEEWGYGWS